MGDFMTFLRVLTAPVVAAAVFAVPANAQQLKAFTEFEGHWQSQEATANVGLMLPFMLDNSTTLFFDIGAAIQEGDVQKGSFGGGYRFSAGSWVGGLYGYYDYLNSGLDNSFHQMSFGAEAIGQIYETRANIYLPIGAGKSVDGAGAGVIDGGTLKFREGMERARPGIDAEIGIKVPGISSTGNAELKLFAGSYWYGGKNMDDMFGAKLRAELAFANLPVLPAGSTAHIGLTGTYDNEDRFDGALMARLRIPFGVTETENAEPFDPWTQRVERNSAIRTHVGATGDLEDAIIDLNGQMAGKVVSISSASGNTSAINARIASAGTSAVILVDGSIGLDQSLSLASGQTLLGGGGNLALRGASSGAKGSYVNQNAAGVLTGYDPSQDVITMASNSVVSSLSISGGLAGIGSNGTSNLFIDSVDVTNTAHDGIRLTQVDGATIQNSRIHDLFICENNTACEFAVGNPNVAPYAAISAHGTRNLTVKDTTIDSVTYGIFAGSAIDDSGWPPVVTDLASNISLDNVTISRSRREGILLVAADTVSMNEVTIDNSQQGRDMDLVVLQGTSNVTITDMTLKGGVNGLMLISASTLPDEAKTTNVRVNGLSIEDTNNAGIFFNPVTDISLSNVTIKNAGTYGMFLYGDEWGFLGGPIKDISFDNVVIDDATLAGLYFMGPSENLTGNIRVINTPRDCKSDASWMGGLSGSISQDPGSVLLLNGTAIDSTNFNGRCG